MTPLITRRMRGEWVTIEHLFMLHQKKNVDRNAINCWWFDRWKVDLDVKSKLKRNRVMFVSEDNKMKSSQTKPYPTNQNQCPILAHFEQVPNFRVCRLHCELLSIFGRNSFTANIPTPKTHQTRRIWIKLLVFRCNRIIGHNKYAHLHFHISWCNNIGQHNNNFFFVAISIK